MTKEIYEAIQSNEDFAKPIRQATRNYTYITSKTLEKLLVLVYGEDWKKHVSGNPISCGNCKLKALQKIANEMALFEKEHSNNE